MLNNTIWLYKSKYI